MSSVERRTSPNMSQRKPIGFNPIRGKAAARAIAMLGAIALADLVAIDAAAADAAPTRCQSGDDVRTVAVKSPGLIGAVCDVSYVRDAGTYEMIPFHANDDAEACIVEAGALVRQMVAEGFACVGDLVASVGPSPTSSPTTSPTPSLPAEAAPVAAFARTDTGVAPAQRPVRTQTFVAADESSSDAADAPRPQRATAAPVNLVASLTPVSVNRTRMPRGKFGQLSGASVPAEADRPALYATDEAGADLSGDAHAGPSVDRLDGGALPSPLPSVPPATADIVGGVVRAQAAAWNEGNLRAFMDGYWNNDGLVLVSDAETRRGWNAVFRHYREAYGDRARDMGRLTLADLDVTLTDEDAATVEGRFCVTGGAAPGAGRFVLNLRQINGLWRIVRDETIADAALGTESVPEVATP